jgi:hypothetical protein
MTPAPTPAVEARVDRLHAHGRSTCTSTFKESCTSTPCWSAVRSSEREPIDVRTSGLAADCEGQLAMRGVTVWQRQQREGWIV